MTTAIDAPQPRAAQGPGSTAPRAARKGSGGGQGSDFSRLSARISDAGLLNRRPLYYAVRLTLVGLAFAAGWVAVFAVGASWWQLAVAGYLGVVYGQLALVAHDLAHRQVFRGRRASEVFGRAVGNLCIGMSYGWWMNKHTRHHANPNHEDLDPDVAPDILVWSREQAAEARGLPRFVGRHQAALFFPLLTLEGFNLHVSSFRALRQPHLKRKWLEGGLLLVHTVCYLGALFWALPVGTALAVLFVHHAVFGVYLGSIFAPNHKGMPTLKGDERPDFLRRQVLTSRNVRGGPLTDLALGGLNYQIEHHLFPSMPTPHLRRARPLVRDYCAELGVPYHETGLVASWREAMRHLRDVGTPIREGTGTTGQPEDAGKPAAG
ncbi:MULTISPECIES: fatty acid desaturase family protein [Streptomyces]|uniref:Delta fatty acid desaturase n=1 Tax=Streptomyces qinglanensis TaxID=943816 RepID=A0A1E7K6X4_9ACTN|nr:acyl-CoA desaturase [Streptomyces qinglanensis]OEU99674.1 delta fatty acid desaturase [Streptomyces qinglanensis]OEV25246.1 delta fatty acid desaturase [Streptomyces nanshensis]